MPGAVNIHGLACSVFRPEIELLQRRGEICFPVSFMDSRLHMQPALLYETIQSQLTVLLKECRGVVLFIGDCHRKIYEFCADRRVVRIDGINCGMILLGRQRYKELMHEQAFLLFPEWTARWRDILLSLEHSCGGVTRHLLRDAQKKLTYLDTGSRPILEAELRACSNHVGLPFEIETVSLDHFSRLVSGAVERLDRQV